MDLDFFQDFTPSSRGASDQATVRVSPRPGVGRAASSGGRVSRTPAARTDSKGEGNAWHKCQNLDPIVIGSNPEREFLCDLAPLTKPSDLFSKGWREGRERNGRGAGVETLNVLVLLRVQLG